MITLRSVFCEADVLDALLLDEDAPITARPAPIAANAPPATAVVVAKENDFFE